MKPSRFGPRVVKGRTPLQQQHAADYKTRPESVLNLLPGGVRPAHGFLVDAAWNAGRVRGACGAAAAENIGVEVCAAVGHVIGDDVMASTATSIEWTDATWNPVTGCSKVSPGCAHCYAETVAGRFWPQQYVHTVERGFISVRDYNGDCMDGRLRQFTDVMTHADRLDQPLHWRKPRRIFVNSMSDLFHEDVPDVFIDRVFAVMALAPRHTFQVLTKRADRMRKYFDGIAIRQELIGIEAERISGFDRYDVSGIGARWKLPLPNVWLGVSVENQRFADERIPLLLRRQRPSGSSAQSRCSGL
jgi:protein gp37